MFDRRGALEKVVSESPYFALESIDVRGMPAGSIGVPHESLGEEVVAVVEPHAGAAVSGAELQEHVAARLARFKVPTTIHFVTEPLPRTATGRVLKRYLRDRFSGLGLAYDL